MLSVYKNDMQDMLIRTIVNKILCDLHNLWLLIHQLRKKRANNNNLICVIS